jgi:uncharacterized Rossmann fold enzyme
LKPGDIRADEILRRLGKHPKVVEVGVFRGALSSRLLVRRDLHLSMVDTWGVYQDSYKQSDDFHAGLNETEQEDAYRTALALTEFAHDRRQILRMDSVEAAKHFADASLDCVFIDADHSYEGCRRDIEAWLPKVKPGGLICGHDYDHPEFPDWGVKRAVDEWFTPDLGGDHTWFFRLPGDLPEPSECYDRLVVACVKWGEKYGPEYVNILRDMAWRNLTIPHRFVCFTDDPTGLNEAVHSAPLPQGLEGWWNKLALFRADAFQPKTRVLFLDLDVCVTGDLNELVEQGGIIADWHLHTYNSSVMCWTHGEHPEVWSKFLPLDMQRLHGDQDWITECGGWETFPSDWCVSYRKHAVEAIPADSKVVCFHGEPKPADVTEGWVPEVWKIGGLAPVRFFSQMNTPEAEMLNNVSVNLQRKLPYFHSRQDTVAIVGGGPSLADHLDDLKTYNTIWTTNGTHDYLIERGIVPAAHVMLDARKDNVRFVQKPHKDVCYLIAAQCHPEVFDALEGYNVRVWLGWLGGLRWNTGVVIGGGATVGLKSIAMAYMAGYRKLALFGFDSSYREDQNHAYPQPLNDGEAMTEVTCAGRKFKCARWMAKQANDFIKQTQIMEGLQLKVYGDGLIPHIVKQWEEHGQRDASEFSQV